MSIQPQWIIYQKWKKKNRTKQYEYFIDNDIALKRRMEQQPTNKQTNNERHRQHREIYRKMCGR